MSGFYEFIKENKLHSNEGETGLKNLNEIAKEIGYPEDGLLYGSAFERFLKDNPGCVEVIKEWIEEYFEEDFEPWDKNDEHFDDDVI